MPRIKKVRNVALHLVSEYSVEAHEFTNEGYIQIDLLGKKKKK